MIPYLLLLLLVCGLGFFLCEAKKSKRSDLIFLVITGSIMFLMCSLRGISVGIDNELYYLPYFEQMQAQSFSFLWSAENLYRSEPGYSLLVYLISRISDLPTVFFTVQAALTIGLTVLLVWRYSSSVWISIFTFISFGFFSYTMCTLRQQLAVCIFLFAVPHLQKKQPIPYVLIVLLASGFHKSLLIALPLYFLAWIPLNWKTVCLYAGGMLCLLMFTEEILDFITQFIYTIYQSDNYYRANGRNIQTAVAPMALCLIAFFLRNRLIRRNPGNLPLINFSVYACCLFILTLKTFIFQRLALIFLPIAVLLLPEILHASGPEPEQVQKLEQYRAENLTRGKKTQSPKFVQLKQQINNEVTLYYSTMVLILITGWLYYLFLLVSNRLLLVPYTTIL